MSDRHDDDQAFHAYLDGESDLSYWYQQTKDLQPPSILDATLRTAANNAVRPPLSRPRRTWWWRWAVPLSAAAVLLLSVTLAVWRRDVYTPLPVNLSPRTTVDDQRPQQEYATPAPEPQRPLATQPQREVDTSKSTELHAQSPVPGVSMSSRLEESRPANAVPLSDRTSASQRATPPAESLAMGGESEGQDADEAKQRSDAERLPPEAWLQQIATLRQQGKIAEAEASLAAFKRRYPHYLLKTRDRARGEGAQGR